MDQPTINLYGADWCPDCHRAKQFLGEHQIPYRWVDIEQDPAGEQYVIQKNNGKRLPGFLPRAMSGPAVPNKSPRHPVKGPQPPCRSGNI